MRSAAVEHNPLAAYSSAGRRLCTKRCVQYSAAMQFSGAKDGNFIISTIWKRVNLWNYKVFHCQHNSAINFPRFFYSMANELLGIFMESTIFLALAFWASKWQHIEYAMQIASPFRLRKKRQANLPLKLSYGKLFGNFHCISTTLRSA